MIVILLIFLLIFLLDFIPLIRCFSKKDMTVFLVIYLSALTLVILKHFKVEIPSMMKLLETIVVGLKLSY